MTVHNGQIANETTFNSAYPSRTEDTSVAGKFALQQPDSTAIADPQKLLNDVMEAVGIDGENDPDLTNYASTEVISDGDSHKEAIEKLDAKYDQNFGHGHSGNVGDGPQIDADNIADVRLQGFFLKGTDLTAITGSSVDVSAYLTGKNESPNDLTLGVVTNSPYNKVPLRQRTGAEAGRVFVDAYNNEVYGQISKAGPVWTLSFLSDVSGVPTPYSFTAKDIAWWYQELFNPIAESPVYQQYFSGGAGSGGGGGGGGGGGMPFQEVPAGTVDGVNDTFTLSVTPDDADAVVVTIDGLTVPNDEYSVIADQIVFDSGSIPVAGQKVYVFYTVVGAPTGNAPKVEYHTLDATDISNGFVTLANPPADPTAVLLDVIGGTSQEYLVDFIVSGSNVDWNGTVLDGLLAAGDKLRILYFI